MQELQQTLMDLVHTRNSVAGYELEKIVKTALNSLDDEEANIATELHDKYFNVDVDSNFKPLKFVHYKVFRNRDGEYTLRRNLYMSPRATGYFSKDDETEDELREIIRSKKSVLGSELKKVVDNTISRVFITSNREMSQEEIAEMSYTNLSIQIARYINDYFINCEKPIKDDVWYGVACKEYATATVYRDLYKSPRPQQKQ